jgi:hypothetical protein
MCNFVRGRKINIFYSVLSCSLFYSILFYSILFYSILFYSIFLFLEEEEEEDIDDIPDEDEEESDVDVKKSGSSSARFFFSPVFRIRIGLSADPDPAIFVNASPLSRVLMLKHTRRVL